MIIALNIILILLVGLLNYQFFSAFIQPKMREEKMQLKKVMDQWHEISLEQAKQSFNKRNSDQ